MPRRSSRTVELPPHVHCVKVKGRPYFYYQPGRNTERALKAVRLPDDPRLPEFWAAWRVAANLPAPRRNANAVSELIKAYKASPEWQQLAESTKESWGIYLKRLDALWGDLEVRGIGPPEVLALRDKFAAQPATANATLRCLSALLSWSVPRGWRADNPCREVKPLKGGAGYAPWPMDMIEFARKELRGDLGWALTLALYSGQRQEDCLLMRWDAIRDGVMHVVQGKTGKPVWVPVHRELGKVLAEIPKRAVTILTSTDGTPWTTDGFKCSWKKNLPAAIKEKRLVFHGLRKSAVVMLLEVGCTTAEVQAITGQSIEMVEHYARQVNQRKLAAAAILKWENASETTNCKTACKTGQAETG